MASLTQSFFLVEESTPPSFCLQHFTVSSKDYAGDTFSTWLRNFLKLRNLMHFCMFYFIASGSNFASFLQLYSKVLLFHFAVTYLGVLWNVLYWGKACVTYLIHLTILIVQFSALVPFSLTVKTQTLCLKFTHHCRQKLWSFTNNSQYHSILSSLYSLVYVQVH